MGSTPVQNPTEPEIGGGSQEPEEVERDYLKHLIEPGKLTTVLCDDSDARTAFVAPKVFAELAEGAVVAYIDLDTQFTVFVRNLPRPPQGLENLLVFHPDAASMDDVVVHVCSTMSPDLELIVFDSVTTFYHVFGGTSNFGRLNQKLGVYLSLFRRVMQSENTSILLTSLAKARKPSKPGVEEWKVAYAGGRVLARASQVLVEVHRKDGFLLATLLKHPRQNLVGKRFRARI